jgi:hypothetical protein
MKLAVQSRQIYPFAQEGERTEEIVLLELAEED